MTRPLRIANTCGFWGDDIGASARTIAADPKIDFLTLDYLAEVSMSILAKLKQREPSAGYANDFVKAVKSLVPAWQSGGKFKVITNAGGLNPRGCARVRENSCDAGLKGMKIGVFGGDDVLPLIMRAPRDFPHLETGRSIDAIDTLVTANAYLGAEPIAEAIKQGADIVITGRVADPSLTVAPCLAHFGWQKQFDALAGATVAGHLIECGTQVTGGISTDWLNLPAANIGFPIVEVSPDGSCVVTKPPGTGGAVNEWTVKEQLLYELGDPGNYLSPDVTASFLTLNVQDLGNDRVRVSGATGKPAPATLKVSATLRAGYRATGTLVVIGRDAVAKARRCGELIRDRLVARNRPPNTFISNRWARRSTSRWATSGSAARDDLMETVIRIIAADDRKRELVEHFARMIVPMVTAGPQGATGYFEGRPAVREVFEYWPMLIDRSLVQPTMEVISV